MKTVTIFFFVILSLIYFLTKQFEMVNKVGKSTHDKSTNLDKSKGNILEKLDDDILHVNRIRGSLTNKTPITKTHSIDDELKLEEQSETAADENWQIASEYYKT